MKLWKGWWGAIPASSYTKKFSESLCIPTVWISQIPKQCYRIVSKVKENCFDYECAANAISATGLAWVADSMSESYLRVCQETCTPLNFVSDSLSKNGRQC